MASQARPKAISAIREFDLIRTLQRRYRTKSPAVLHSIGDDAAVIVPERNRRQLLTTDLLTEGIHFDLGTATFFDIGFRAGAANLSDIAAMGGNPEYLLVSIAIPRSGTGRQVSQLYRGMMAACRPHKVRLIGGDTSASAAGWFINITLVGSATARRVLLRSGARVGDDLYVTGTLGDSLAGLTLLSQSQRGTVKQLLSPRHRRFLIDRHLRPTARILEGRWLSAKGWATAAIDISDGLSGDLRHICEESHVGAEINLSALPTSPACRSYAKSTKQDPVTLALAGGEDYELLFTVSHGQRTRFERAARATHLHVTRIGTITPARAGLCMITQNGQRRPLPFASYEHFRPTH
jgi:thiamine-monophosphate kinase